MPKQHNIQTVAILLLQTSWLLIYIEHEKGGNININR